MPLISNKQKAFEGDVVELSTDIPSFNAKRGQRAVVITTFAEPSEAYDLELENESGDFLGFAYSIKPDLFVNLSRAAFVRAMKAVERSDLATAERELKAATELRPDYIGGFVLSVLASFGQHESAGLEDDVSIIIPLLRMAVRVDPTYEIARINLAVAFLNFGVAKARKREHREALELFYSALSIKTEPETELRIKTNIVIAQTALGRELFQANRIEEAFAAIRAAFLEIQDEITRRNLGLACGNSGIFYLRSHRFDLAAQMFERAEDSGVVLPEYVNNYGVCLVFLGRNNEAIQAFERVLGIEPRNEMASFNLKKLSQVSARELSAPELDSFADQLFVPLEDLADFNGRTPEEMVWRKPSISAQEFAFA